MFFRRVFGRKEPTANGFYPPESPTLPPIDSPNAHRRGGHGPGRPPIPNQQPTSHNRKPPSSTSSSDDNNKRVLSVLQLTPLWEHIIRNKALPTNINESDMFDEFLERLRDPEWQVRQHALRVLVDVLIVMKRRADGYFNPLIPSLVENLGHAAPAIRKGALDVLKVHMSETERPDLVLQDIIELGIAQPISSSPIGRLSVGVMLSLPSLIQTILDTSHRNQCLRMTIQALCLKMVQVTYQEVSLKVLLRIRELVGSREFAEHIPPATLREFELLCNVYGLPRSDTLIGDSSNDLYISTSAGGQRTWQVLTNSDNESSSKWKSKEGNLRQTTTSTGDDTEYETTESNGESAGRLSRQQHEKPSSLKKNHSAKLNPSPTLIDVPLSAKISIPNQSRVRLKPLGDQNTNNLGFGGDERVILETEINIDNTAVTMRILEQSTVDAHEIGYEEEDEDDDDRPNDDNNVYEHSGIVRVLTDSELDEVNETNYKNSYPHRSSSNYGDHLRSPRRVTFGGESVKMRTPDSESISQSDVEQADKQPLHINIPSDNTKPLERAKSAVSKMSTMSPVRRVRRLSMSPADEPCSLTPPHRQIEVLHNLQRSPLISPTRASRRNSTADEEQDAGNGNQLDNGMPDSKNDADKAEASEKSNNNNSSSSIEEVTDWEDLGMVDEKCLQNLQSGDWRLRSQAINTIDESLKHSDNMTLVQPSLESFLRMLLSSEKHPDVAADKRRIVTNLITRLPLDTLERRTTQIIIGLCRHGGAGSNRVAKTLMQRLLPTVVVHRLLSDEFLQARSTRFRENALQMVLYALMTFPSTYFDLRTCVERATRTATDRKRRVRQAALDVLAVLGQISSTKLVMDIVQQTLTTITSTENGQHLSAAVKARLSRKQLPTVSADGNVQYALRIPTADAKVNSQQAMAMLPNASYLFGADVDWIVSGIGSVSPTSVKRRSIRMQQQNDEAAANRQSMESAKPSMTPGAAATKTPHELLAVGVGVKPAYTEPASGGGGNGHSPVVATLTANGFSNCSDADATNALQVNQLNTHVSIGSDIPNQPFDDDLLNGNLHRPHVRFNSRSFPELSDELGSISRLPIRVQKRLPVTSRFPAMETHSDGRLEGKNGHPKQHQQHPRQRHQPTTMTASGGGSVGAAPNPKRFTTHHGAVAKTNYSKYAQDSLMHQSISEDERPISSAAPRFTMDANYLNESQRRFTHVYKFFSSDTPAHDRLKPSPDVPENTASQLPMHRSPKHHHSSQHQLKETKINSTSTTPTIYRDHQTVSHQSLYDELEHTKQTSHQQFSNKNASNAENISDSGTTTGTASEYSTEELSASGTSTPTRRLVVDGGAGGDQAADIDPTTPSEEQTKPTKPTVPSSRPLSMASQRTINRRLSQDETDKHLNSSPSVVSQRSNTSGSIKRSDRSTTSSTVDINSRASSNSAQFKSETSLNSLRDTNILQLPEEFPKPNENYSGDPDDRPLSTASQKSNITNQFSVTPVKMSFLTVQEKEEQHQGSVQNLEDETQPESLNNNLDDDQDPDQQSETEEYVPSKPAFISKRNRPPVLMRKRKVSPTKSLTNLTATSNVQGKNKNSTQQSLYPKSLAPFDKPRESLQQCHQLLESTNWEETMTGLQSFVRFMRHHPDIIESQLHVFCMALSKHIKNLRSQVSRASCQAASELFERKAKLVETEAEDLTMSLLNRTADTNKFLRCDAMQALESMCDHLPPNKVFHVMVSRGATHQNAVVRSAAAKLCARTVERIGYERVYSGLSKDLRDRMFLMSANLLMEGSLETRNHAKAIFKMLSAHPTYNRTLLEVIPTKTFRNIEKTLKSIR